MLLMNAWLLKLQSRPRIRRLKLSGTVQGLVQEPAVFDGRAMRTRSALGMALGRAALARVAEVCFGAGRELGGCTSGHAIATTMHAERIH